MHEVYDSSDPLVRDKEKIWETDMCGTLAVAFKLHRPTPQTETTYAGRDTQSECCAIARLVWAPWSRFVFSLQQAWTSEMRFLLTEWDWQRPAS